MKMNRRNVLVGLGTIVAGGGAALGTGAFSTVSADRTVSISAAGDDSALLSIEVTGAIAGSNGDTIQFNLDNGVNLDATTRFNGALTITNNGSNPVNIDILDENDDSMVDGASASDTSHDMTFEPTTDGDENDVSATDGTVTFDIVFDLTGKTSTGDASIPGTVTISAEDSS